MAQNDSLRSIISTILQIRILPQTSKMENHCIDLEETLGRTATLTTAWLLEVKWMLYVSVSFSIFEDEGYRRHRPRRSTRQWNDLSFQKNSHSGANIPASVIFVYIW
ncbi:hypothetical protein RF11_03906 [Thelohanellus kitauei]|uniref:Uncharacterized protein n=1 Tax=Thelohanellus kitauei TaxID=669202 RepID=A0A0C2NAL2_THEKT|nr:hypothetical protein RF11_03906 [Thelohanellus kitauei]